LASLVRRHASYEDLLLLAEEPVAELVGGNLYTSPRLSLAASVSASALSAALASATQPTRGDADAWWILFEPELQLLDDVLVPDLAGWKRERLARPPETAAIDLVPDWICEVLSPRTESFDRAHKLPAYARHGIPHAWLVDPALRSLEVLRRERGRFVHITSFAADERACVEPFESLALDLTQLWGGLASDADRASDP